MNAIIWHIWRLLTFRHDMTGLRPKSLTTVALIISLSMLLALVRWTPETAVIHGLFLAVIATFGSPRAAMALALLSIGIDAIALPVEHAVARSVALFGWWELLARTVSMKHTGN